MVNQKRVEAYMLGAKTLGQLVCNLVDRALIADQAKEATLALGRFKAPLEPCGVQNIGIVVLSYAAERRGASREARPGAACETRLGRHIRITLGIPYEFDARSIDESVELR